MPVTLRPATAALLLVAVLVIGSTGSLVVTEAVDDQPADPTFLPLETDDRQLWSYTSTGHSFDRATLPITAVVYGDPTDLRRQLLERGTGEWNETEPDEQDALENPTATDAMVQWRLTTGSTRYVYLSGEPESGGTWFDADYQVHDGTYLGSRHHVRAYTSPDDDGAWTAMQAHHEHWDWFAGRHIVTSTETARTRLERELVAGPGTPEIRRVPVENAGQFERWLTVVDFREIGAVASVLPLLVLGAFAGRFSTRATALGEHYPRREVRALLVAAGIVAVTLGVRALGIRLEQFLSVPPKTIAFALYPILFVGLPVVTYLLARPLDRSSAFAAASLGFVAAVLLDYTSLGVTQMALSTLVLRGALAAALGLIAAGSSREERRDPAQVSHVRLGVLLWLVATLLPLLRHTPLPV